MGNLISRLLFQPPDPPSYKDDKHIIWLDSDIGTDSKKKRRSKKSSAPSSSISSSTEDLESSPVTSQNDKMFDDDGGIQALENGKIQIPSVFLEYKGSDLCLLYSHGNATDMGQMMPYLELLRSSLKINVCSYEYQGYGICKPKIRSTEQGIYNSIKSAVRYLVETRGIPQNKIIVFGTSLGTGPSTWIASQEGADFRGLVLQSPFTSVVRIKVPMKQLAFFDMFENIDRIDKVKCPVFIIHGRQDEVVPFDHAETLHKKLQTPYGPLFIDYAGHNNIMEIMSVERYLKHLFKFIVFLNEHAQKQQQSTTNNDTNGINV